MPAIFISYRRNDAPGSAGRLAERLVTCFGPEQVFRDRETLQPGDDFNADIRDAIRASVVVLVVIGPRWLDVRDEDGNRRLDDQNDIVRMEIETARRHRVKIIPVLVEGADVPNADDLPTTLRFLVDHNAHEISERRWAYDTGELVKLLERETGLAIFPDQQDREHSVAPSKWVTLSDTLINAIPNLLGLLSGPRRFLARHNSGKREDLTEALTFFILIAGIAYFVVGATVDSFGTSLTGIVGWILGLLIATLFLSVPLWIGWLMAGARHHYARTTVTLLYQVATFILLGIVSGALMLAGLELTSPGIIEKIHHVYSTEVGQRAAQTSKVLDPAFSGPTVFVFAGLMLLLVLGLAAWLVASWGAYRDALNKTRLRSSLAFLVFAVTTMVPLGFFAWLGSP